MRHRLAAGLVLVVCLASCRTWTAATPSGVGAPESLDAALWMRTSAEYYALAEQAFRLASVQVDEALKPENRSWTAALEQTRGYEDLPPAVLVDSDEAVLDTSGYQIQLVASGRRFRRADWNAWVQKRKSRAIPGAVEFLKGAAAKGVRIFYVTNRDVETEDATRQNLQDLGFPVDADGANILSRDERPDWGGNKDARRRFVAASHRIILIVGDDLVDFVAGSRTDPAARVALARKWRSYWGTRWIMIPNVFYGGWEQALYGFDHSLDHAQVLKRKEQALEALARQSAASTTGR